MKKLINNDLLHLLKELARIEHKYRPRIIALTSAYWQELDALITRIDITMGVGNGQDSGSD